MWLKDLDEYIRGKLNGYKPEVHEDLWKGIEKKLPPPRVPQGKGSWLIGGAAVLMMIVSVPMAIKFNDALNDRQASSEKSGQYNSSRESLSSENTQSQKKITAENHNGNNPEIHRFTQKIQRDWQGVQHQIANKNTGISLTGDISKDISYFPEQSIHKVKDGLTYLSHCIIPSKEIENHVSDMGDMPLVTFNVQGKYPDRKKGTNAEWENWQSIYYPFWQNPAYTGCEGRFNATVDDKIDVVPDASTTHYANNFAFDARLPFLGLSAGIYHSRYLTPFSLQSNTGFALSKQIFRVDNAVLKAGVSATILNNSLFYNSLLYSDQIDKVFGFIKPTHEKDPVEMTSSFGLNGGLWFSNKHFMAGMDVTNFNQPRPHHLSEAQPLPRIWHAMAAYRVETGNFQLLPMVEVKRQNKVNQTDVSLTSVYKNNWMLSLAYQDITPNTFRGNLFVYAGANVFKNLRLFAGWGYNIEWQQVGVNEQFVHGGIKYQIR